MKTLIAGREGLPLAARLIRQGEIVAFPTETVYGLGGDAFDASAVKKIYEAKGRPSDNPLIVHIGGLEDVDRAAENVPPVYYELARRFLPGPLTVVLPKRREIPYACTGGLDTVAVRYPSCAMARELVNLSGTLIAAPSANRSEHVSPTAARHVYEDMNGRIPLILDGGECAVGIESTILSLCTEVPTILRPGIITAGDLLPVLGTVELFRGRVERAEAPGMKYRHYAPDCRAVLASAPESAVRLYDDAANRGLRAEILSLTSNRDFYGSRRQVDLGGDVREVARHIYGAMHAAEHEADLIIIDRPPKGEIGDSVMNRVLKAVAGQVDG